MKSQIKDKLFTLGMMLIVIIGMLLSSSCRSVKPVIVEVPSEQTIVHDSTIYHVRDSVVIIPVEKSVNILVPQEPSHLETSIAVSDAWLDEAGLLHHSISNKQGNSYEKHEEKEIVIKDSICYIPQPYAVPEYIKRDLTWLQKTLIAIGVISIILFILFVIYVFWLSNKKID